VSPATHLDLAGLIEAFTEKIDIPQAKREEFIAELKTTEKGVTPNAVWQRLRKELKSTKIRSPTMQKNSAVI
jgi:hypothetical protein